MTHEWKSILVAAGLAAVAPAWAAQPPSHAPTTAPAAKAAALTEGEVRKVDKKGEKVTLRHGAIANLEMPPMTMVFRVKDAALLDSLKEGDKVRFRAEMIGGAYTLTEVLR